MSPAQTGRCCAQLPLLNKKGKALGGGATLADFTFDEFMNAERKRCPERAEWMVVTNGDSSSHMPVCRAHAETAKSNYHPSMKVELRRATGAEIRDGEKSRRRMDFKSDLFHAMAKASPQCRAESLKWGPRQTRKRARRAA